MFGHMFVPFGKLECFGSGQLALLGAWTAERLNGDDEVGLSGDGAFEYPIVRLIFDDDFHGEVGRNDLGHSDQKLEKAGDLPVGRGMRWRRFTNCAAIRARKETASTILRLPVC